MKPLCVVCSYLVLADTLVLAQSVSTALNHQVNGMSVAQEAHALPVDSPRIAEGATYPQSTPAAAEAKPGLVGHSHRKLAKPMTQTGPEQVLYAFQPASFGGGVPNDGYFPQGSLIFDSKGNLYGTTYWGGSGGGADCNGYQGWGCGTVFELSPDDSGDWTEAILYSFQAGTDGSNPSAGLIFDQAGNLYGTTPSGGSNHWGIAFELSPSGSGEWTETVLYSFGAYTNDAENPSGTLVFDKSGNLYGAASGGGQNPCSTKLTTPGCGAVFELSPNGSGGWTESILYNFTGGTDGQSPNSPLVFDQSGNLYGTTHWGGNSSECVPYGFPPSGCGTAFELSPNGSGGWTETTLYTFQGGSDGGNSTAGLIFDQSGNLYGTNTAGGSTTTGNCGNGPPGGCGAAFELSPKSGGSWTETTLHEFQGGSDGEWPTAGLVFDQSGNLYGTASEDGAFGYGTVFELSPDESGGWTEAVLYDFQGVNSNGCPPCDGGFPLGGLVSDQVGNLYGTTQVGGSYLTCNDEDYYGCGTVFEVFKEPFAVFSPTSLGFGNQTVGIASSPQAVTLTNSGILPLTITSIQITGANSGDFGQNNNCPASLGPQNSCQINVTFTPTAAGNRSAAVTVTDNAPGSPQSVPLSGVGVLPGVTFSPTSLPFGDQTAGTKSSPEVTNLTNNGQGTLTITAIGISGANANQFSQTNNCPSSLAPNGSCNVSVTFAPTAVGDASASLSVTDSAPGSPQTVPLTGTGVIGVSISPSSVNFPSQYVGTAGLPQSVTLTNTGNTVLTIKNVTASPGDFAPLSACGNSLQPGDKCSIGVFFDPTTNGQRNGVLTITDSAIDSPQTVPLSGMGEDFSVAPSSSSSATVTPGQNAQYTIAVAPLGGFNQTVTLSCTGAPAMSTCSVSPSSVTLSGSGSTPVTVLVATTGSSAGLTYPGGLAPTNLRLALWFGFTGLPGVVLLGGGLRKRRSRMLYGVLLLCVLSIALMWTACGGGSSTGSGGSGGTPAGSYNLTVTGEFSSGSASLVHSTKLTLVVQ